MKLREIMAALIDVPCHGFHMSIGLHLDEQAHFDLLVSTCKATVETKTTDAGSYDVGKYTGNGGTQVTLFGPVRPARAKLTVVQ